MITATPVTVPTTAGGIKLGDFANVYVTISNQGGFTVYLGTTTSVTTSGFGVPTGTVLPMGRVTGTLWAIASGSPSIIGLLIVSPE